MGLSLSSARADGDFFKKRIFWGHGWSLMPQQLRASTANLCNSELRGLPTCRGAGGQKRTCTELWQSVCGSPNRCPEEVPGCNSSSNRCNGSSTQCLEVLHHITKGKALLEWHHLNRPVFPGASMNLLRSIESFVQHTDSIPQVCTTE